MKCGICGSETTETVFGNMEGYHYRGNRFSIDKCRSCRVGFLYPQVSFTEVEKSCYADGYHAYQDFRKEEGFFSRVKNLIKQSALQGGYYHPGVVHDGLIAFWNPSKKATKLRLLLTDMKTDFSAESLPATSFEFSFEFRVVGQ